MKARISLVRSLCLLLACAGIARAEVTIQARLDEASTSVGSPVQFQIDVSGATQSIEKPEIEVDGLEIGFNGTSRSVQFNGAQVSTTMSLTYQVVGTREGDFTIPELTVKVDGKNYRTRPVALKVRKDAGNARAFAEIELPKKTAYVGEVVPVEVRLFVDERVRVMELAKIPDLTGDGFTMKKFPANLEETVTRDGQGYNVAVFRTVMTPSKAGKLTIGPCEIPFIAKMPRQRTRNRNSPFDLFDDDFFNPLGAQTKRYDAKAPAVEIDVKPLPVEGRPKDFSGAVGKFQMTAEGTPTRIKYGDPVTMRVAITGEGDFDRVKAPTIANPEGWQVFDPSEKLNAGNETNTSGTKRFEMPVVAEKAQKRMPAFVFSYFDPVAEKYETLKSKPGPLTIDGAPTGAPRAEPTATADSNTEPAPATKNAEDIAGLRYEVGSVRTFAPLYARPWFRWVNAGLLTAALALVLARLLHREPEQLRTGALRRERDDFLRRLGDSDGFAENAAHAVQTEAALAAGMEAASVDAAMARRALALGDEEAAVVERIFDERAAMLYAGERSESRISETEKERIVQVLRRICRR